MEIGGYFELEQNEDNSYYKDAIKLNSGRNCLRVLIRNRHIKHIYLPYYICDTVVEICRRENCRIDFYFLGERFKLKDEIADFKCDTDYLYLVNYCGLLTKEEIINLKNKYQNIILDNTQAFFIRPLLDIDTIYSCRKFFGVPDGGYLYTSADISEQYTQDYSYNKMAHILGRYEMGAEAFYKNYVQNEENISFEPIKYMSKLTDNMMRSIDYNKVIKIRNQNYYRLTERLQYLNELTLSEKLYGAFAYPLLIKNADKLRRRLIQEKIFIPQYWKEVLQKVPKETIEYQYTQNILWIPCDQRYTEVEMDYIADKIDLAGGK
ncbi:MAG: hypothetical protein NC118_02815 [Eubacterium sp.]|nr:hypothetical protein [Eubacterium sp.]